MLIAGHERHLPQSALIAGADPTYPTNTVNQTAPGRKTPLVAKRPSSQITCPAHQCGMGIAHTKGQAAGRTVDEAGPVPQIFAAAVIRQCRSRGRWPGESIVPMTGDRLAKLNAAHEFDTWYKPRRPLHTSVNHVELHRFAAERIGRETNLRYLEFGVYQGASMRRAAALYTNPDTNFFGFDSFEGLPERWITMQAGHFSTGGEPPAVKDPRVQFHKGWFQNTVRDFLPTLNRDPTKTTLVHFDADLYSSTLFLLTSLWWHIPEYFFIFDEFFGEELLAMKNFVTAYPVAFEFLACVESGAGQPRQLFGRLRNIEMVVGSAASAQEL